MSYVVAIWDQPRTLPLPGDIDAASRLITMLYRMEPGTNPKYVELIRRLTARYPDICSPEAEVMDESEWAWIDGPLSGDGPECVYNLGIGMNRFDEVRPFVIATARELGLHVFDEQAAEAHFADGTHVSRSQSRDTGFERAVAERLADFMRTRGYAIGADGKSFLRQFETGWGRVELQTGATWPPHYDLHFVGQHENWTVSDLYDAISFGKPPHKPGEPRGVDDGPLGIISHSRWIERFTPFVSPEGKFRIRGVKELDAATPALARQLEQGLLKLLMQAETIEGYAALINPPKLTDSTFFIEKTFHGWERGYRNVLAAHLTNDPRVHEICAAVEDGLEGEPPWSTVFFNTRKCIDFVRRERGMQWGKKR